MINFMALSYYFDDLTDNNGYSISKIVDGSAAEVSNTYVGAAGTGSSNYLDDVNYSFDFYAETNGGNLETYEFKLDFGDFFKADLGTTITFASGTQAADYSIDAENGTITVTGAALHNIDGGMSSAINKFS